MRFKGMALSLSIHEQIILWSLLGFSLLSIIVVTVIYEPMVLLIILVISGFSLFMLATSNL
jgi:hypothetical protein